MQLLQFLLLYLFLGQFLPDLDEYYQKFREDSRIHAYWLGLYLDQVLTGPKTAVFSSLSLTNWKDQDFGP
jgi:hypothetical protein